MSDKVWIITGPTGGGKSSVADVLLSVHGCCVINADSKQIYKELPIITDQPTGVIDPSMGDYYLYGHRSVKERYSVVEWLQEISCLVNKLLFEGRIPVLVGGSMMYIKSLLEGISMLPDIQQDIFEKWDKCYLDKGKHGFLTIVEEVLGYINSYKDRYRAVRNTAFFEQTGRDLSGWHHDSEQLHPLKEIEFELLVLMPDRKLLYEHINARTERMLNTGAVDELRYIKDYKLSNTARSILGVVEIGDYLDERLSFAQALELFQCRSRRYAKRQMTWCRNVFNKAKFFASKSELLDYCVSVLIKQKRDTS